MYGHLIDKHPLFSGLHVDLLRQIVGKLDRCIYFPQNVIIESGDVDDTMYFIHDGEVEVLEKGKPHKNMYKARTTVEVLMLRRTSWIHLLDFFPDSKEQIYNRIVFPDSSYMKV
ncbi:hypothetical protein L9F63_019448 [Diploptera punctata]|uniref:Cyclic nucleotide-binding domain-containing protein n=1 Tax=Diploptera punctata TaxID=6984 RepID=A0AAD7ZUJ3_DIPPU|nr:hypothetical protein L9F63_019448 [Diploptera punctata]